MTPDPRLLRHLGAQPYPLLFATISGAHLYGFASPDSDYDLRGVHLLPIEEVLRLRPGRETIEFETVDEGLEIDLVTHDAKKFFGLMLKRNGYVLEQLHSPLVLHTTPAHEELLALGPQCVTRHHAHHYLGFADTQWKLFVKETPSRIKPLLYLYRVLLTGIHLMRTGRIEANLGVLNEEARLPRVAELMARKQATQEQATLDGDEFDFHAAEYRRLVALLEEASKQSSLPDEPTAQDALDDLLVRLRLKGT
jgi:predicted nucleotidyltransferase